MNMTTGKLCEIWIEKNIRKVADTFDVSDVYKAFEAGYKAALTQPDELVVSGSGGNYGEINMSIISQAPPNLEEANKLLEAKVKELENQVDGLQDKIIGIVGEDSNGYPKTCACSWECKDDICGLHSPKLKTANDKIAELTAKCEQMREAFNQCVNDFEEASQYKGDYLSDKHRDAESIAEYRKLLEGV